MANGKTGAPTLPPPPKPSGGSGKPGAVAPSCPIPSKASLDVTAQDQKGAALDGVKVKISGPESRNGTTGTGGTTSFSGIKPGSYTVAGTKKDFTSDTTTAAVPANGKGTATLKLKAVTELTVLVTTKAAKPTAVEGAKVDVSSTAVDINTAVERTAPTDKNGRAVFKDVPTGPQQVQVTKAGFRKGGTLVTVKAGKNNVTVQLAAAGTLSGKVIDAATSKGIGNAQVSVVGNAKMAPTKSAADGSFTFGEVEAGDLEVRAVKDGFAPGSAKTKVTAGSNAPIEIKLTPIIVKIRAADGASDPPTAVAINKNIVLAGVLNVKVAGSFLWTRSAAALVSLKNSDKEKVTVEAGKTPGTAPEEIQLVFTPKDQPPLAPVKHKLSVGEVVFSKEATHPFGYDAFEKIPCVDNNKNKTTPEPPPKMDFISVEKSKTGKVKATLKGLKPADVFFKSTKENICAPKVPQPTGNPFVLEIDGKVQNKATGQIDAHVGSAAGPVSSSIGVVVLKLVKFKGEYFRVKDSTSATTALKHTKTGAELQSHANDVYKQAVTEWDIIGGAAETDVAYDLNKNGILDLEPGKDSPEFKKIKAACKPGTGRTGIVYVKKLRMTFFLAKDAKAADTKITLKNVGAHFLGFFGEGKTHTVDDKNGKSTKVKLKKVNTATGVFELDAAIGQDFKVSDQAALIFGLAGLSGNPLVVSDANSDTEFLNVAAHELGHEVAGLDDICEIDNFMFGGSDAKGQRLRHRPIPVFREPKKNEEQWKIVKGR